MNPSNSVRRINELFTALLRRGFFHILSASALSKIAAFLTSVIVIRILAKETFGVWSYADTIVRWGLIVSGFGAVGGVLQFCTEQDQLENKLKFLKLGLVWGVSVNTVVAVAIIVITQLFSFPIVGSSDVATQLSFVLPLIVCFHILLNYLRSKFQNTAYSSLLSANSAFVLLLIPSFAYLWGLQGMVAGRYAAFLLTVLFGLFLIRNELAQIVRSPLPSKKAIREFLSYSFLTCGANVSSELLYLIDTFLVGLIIQETAVVASYKTATLIPFALNFIPLSIVIFITPYIIATKDDIEGFKTLYVKLQIGLLGVNATLSVLLFAFAPLIIRMLFGEEYLDSVPVFRVLAVGYFVAATFRIPAGNTLAALRKVHVNLYNSIACGVLNIVLDLYLIRKYGVIGAAYATLSIFVLSSIIANAYLVYYVRKETSK